MKHLLLLVSFLLVPAFALADPVQWTYESGGNGHWYEYVSEITSWFGAENGAASRSHDGNIGFLATVTSASEENWIRQALNLELPVWLGAHIESSTGPWYWITAEPFDYENWEGGSTPYGPSLALQMSEAGWVANNHISSIYHSGYVVEYLNNDNFLDGAITLNDIPSDQGGFISFSWERSGLDAPALPDSISFYHAQRFENGDWETLVSVVATHADTYQVTVPTSDILTIGDPEPFSVYRVVASSSDPTEFYLSAVDSAYSIDNIAPPVPDAFLIQGDDFLLVGCTDPEISDLDQVCFYRGLSSGFVPENPIHCSEEFVFMEPHLINAFYRVQFMDIHGNLSEFSEEVTLSDPSGVGDSVPLAFGMEQNFPNPFNPSTTIKFSLPESAPVTLRVYDVSGKLVRDLISGQMMEAGRCEKVWMGQDDRGQSVSAGIYFYKLTAGDFTSVRRMALVK